MVCGICVFFAFFIYILCVMRVKIAKFAIIYKILIWQRAIA